MSKKRSIQTKDEVIMKRSGLFIAVFTLFLLVGCSHSSNEPEPQFDGTWRGAITERGKDTAVELTITTKSGVVQGTFTVLSETGADIGKGSSFNIVESKIDGTKLTFTVPINGTIDDDSIEFNFQYMNNKLMGECRELREGSNVITVTLNRK